MNKHHRPGKSPARSPSSSALAEGIRHRVRLRIDSAGRILIPAEFRTAMGLEEGTTVLTWLEHGELHLVGAKSASAQAQRLARKLISGRDSLADQLLADRREEARREDKNG